MVVVTTGAIRRAKLLSKRLCHAIEVGNISHRAGDNTNIMQ